MSDEQARQHSEPCSQCSGCGEIVTPVVIGYDDKGNPIIDHQSVICSACYGSGNA